MVRASHNVGKSYLAACLVNWWYDSFAPGIVLTTAPTQRQVQDILWKEVRNLRTPRGGFPGPVSPRLASDQAHFAAGFTARDGTRFQGHHSPAVLIVFDEAVGVAPEFWEAAPTMLAGHSYAFLAIYNPTDQGSRAYSEERKGVERGAYHVVGMSALDHPNIAAELSGLPPPYPSAIRLQRLTEMLSEWSTPLAPGEAPLATDLEWPPGSGKWIRPGPVAEARLLGRWPTVAVNSVFSDAAWRIAETKILAAGGLLQIGCDVARYGDDDTAIHIRQGGISLHHEAHNGWSIPQTVARLQLLAAEFGAKCNPPVPAQRVPIAVDDTGVGGGVTDYLRKEGYNVVAINFGETPFEPLNYPNKRSELWFALAGAIRQGLVSLARLPRLLVDRLRQQALGPVYRLDAQARRVVEAKADTKARLGRSPDDLDAMLLAYAALPPPDRVGGYVQG